MKKAGRIIAIVVGTFMVFIGFLGYFSAKWYISTYGDVGVDSIIYTLFRGVTGAASNVFFKFLVFALLPAVLLTVVAALILFYGFKKKFVLKTKKKNRQIYPFPRWFAVIVSAVLSGILCFSAAVTIDLVGYVKYMLEPNSTIYEDFYVDPMEAEITFPEEKRNLIFIFLESMENSFFSVEHGGGNDVETIPELYDLAKENINFSHNDGVGGASALAGSTWTVAAMVSHTSGVPLKMPLNVEGNQYGQTSFLTGLYSLTDVLRDNGYYQALMVGSDASYGSRKQYYEQHGIDKIYDIYSAREDGIVPEGYHVWWGMEDLHTFDYAKKELPEIAAGDKPFAFTLLTVDTHQADGYVCKYCDDEHEEQYENVYSCSSRQVLDFVNWVKTQDFYENTSIIICGDHLTMDAAFIKRNVYEGFDRRTYNCFINVPVTPSETKNREFTTFDMFPTTLTALGCEIKGERLGLGTNLFSEIPTLSEALGKDYLSEELKKKSDFYGINFYFER